jgi:hypothetical protein
VAINVANQFVGFAFETTPGTAVTVTQFPPYQSIDVKGKYSEAIDDSHRFGQFGIPIDGMEIFPDGVEGTIEGNVYSKGFIAQLLEWAMGPPPTVTASSPIAGYTKRVFAKGSLARTGTVQRLVARDGAEDAYTYTGCVVQELMLSGSVKNYLGYKATFLGREEKDNVAAASASYAGTGKPFRLGPTSIALAVTDPADGAAQFVVCYESYDLTIANNYSEIDTWCGKDISVEKAPEVRMSLKNGDYSKTWWSKMVGNATLSLVITHTMIGDVNTTFKLTVPAVKSRTGVPGQSAGTLRNRQDVDLVAGIPASGGIITIETTATT